MKKLINLLAINSFLLIDAQNLDHEKTIMQEYPIGSYVFIGVVGIILAVILLKKADFFKKK